MNAIDTAINYSDSIEIDLESNLFKIKDNKNLIKPKQCYRCLLLFTPEDKDDNFCSDCKKEGFMPEEIKLKKCETPECENMVKGKKRFCDICRENKIKQRKKDYYRDIAPKKKNLIPGISPAKREISTTDSPFEKLIKGVFFTFENEIKAVTFKMKSGEAFTISGEA